MIGEFLGSWGLFQNVYLSGWLIGVLLALVGVLVVIRDQIFVSAAVSQASTLGIALGLWASTTIDAAWAAHLGSDVYLSTLAVILAIIATLITARGKVSGYESSESITGWVFLVSATGSILLLTHSPHGLEEIHRLLSSSLIGATSMDVWIFTALSTITTIMVMLFYRPILLFALDAPMATTVGMRLGVWTTGSAAWLGLTIGLSMRASGMLYTFGCLVLPALVAKNTCREIRSMFVVAPLVALGSGGAGFVLAHHYDYPPAQMTVFLQCTLLAMAWASRWLRHRFVQS